MLAILIVLLLICELFQLLWACIESCNLIFIEELYNLVMRLLYIQ